MNRFLTNEQAAYLSQIYTGTDTPKLHKAPTMYVHDLEQRYAERGMTIQWLERTICDRNKTIERLEVERDRIERLAYRFRDHAIDRFHDYRMEQERTRELGLTVHRLERKLRKANRKHRALHRAMHEDTERVRGSLIKAAERLARSIATPSPVEESAYGAAWPRFADGAPVVIGDCVKGVMCDVHVASIVFRYNCVLLYDSQMFHYVKLDGGETAQRPDGTRLALD